MYDSSAYQFGAARDLVILRDGVHAALRGRSGHDYLTLAVHPRGGDESFIGRATIGDRLLEIAYGRLLERVEPEDVGVNDVVAVIDDVLPYDLGTQGVLRRLAPRKEHAEGYDEVLHRRVWTLIARFLDTAITQSQSLRPLLDVPMPRALRVAEIRNAILERNGGTILANFDPRRGPLKRYVAGFAKVGSLRTGWEVRPVPEVLLRDLGADAYAAALDARLEEIGNGGAFSPEVRECLEGVDPLVVLYLCGECTADSATRPGETPHAFRQRVHRARLRLRGRLRELFAHHGDEHKEET